MSKVIYTDSDITPERIKRLRTTIKRTQAQFAKLAGVDPITISRWENGHCSPAGVSTRSGLVKLMNQFLGGQDHG